MPYSGIRSSRPYAAIATVTLVVAVMSACVLGLAFWKAVDSRNAALAQGQRDIRNLAHSLSEQASRSIQATDIAMSGIVDLLKYQRPRRDRLDPYLRNTVRALPQLSEIGVFDASGAWIHSSRDELPDRNNSDRSYFTYHRDSADPGLRVSDPLVSRTTGRRTIVLSRRISTLDGSFGGVVIATIDSESFDNFYNFFEFGPHASITLARNDGIVLARWPASSRSNAYTPFKAKIESEASGYFRAKSPIDGFQKYYGFEHTTQYPLVVLVALTEDQLLAEWRQDIRRDVIVAAVLMCSVILLAVLLSMQFRARLRVERELREREAHYRLLADNIADVVILLGKDGVIRFVSQSIDPVLGLKPDNLLGRRCLDLIHPDDHDAVRQATAELTDPTVTRTIVFRTWRRDGSIAWIESNFKLAGASEEHLEVEIVGTLRDVTARRMMEDKLNALNARLAALATIDGLTGLANRRTFDTAVHREFAHRQKISVIMLDIDNFKGFNDSFGHQAGDRCLQQVAQAIARGTPSDPALAARYGGEEFGIVLPDTDEQDALRIAEAIRLNVQALAMENPASASGHVSISLGIATRTGKTENERSLVGEADRALYEAKDQGRNCSVVASQLAPGETSSPPLSPEIHDSHTPLEAAQ